jgi:hypothetical protein
MKNNYVFGKLFAEPSFVEGVSRVLDVGGTMQEYNTSETENEADIEALKNDWRAVGEDLAFSIKRYEQKLPKSA